MLAAARLSGEGSSRAAIPDGNSGLVTAIDEDDLGEVASL